MIQARLRNPALAAFVLMLAACSEGDTPPATPTADAPPAAVPSPLASSCAPDDGGLTLPAGFCAMVASEGVGAARHVAVRGDGDVFVAIRDRGSRGQTSEPGGILALRDTTGDGRFDVEERWGDAGGNEVLLDGEDVYLATNAAVLRYRVPSGALTPVAGPDTVVSGLPSDRNHAAKSLALVGDDLFVNIGAPSNACMRESRTQGSPGMDPCPELETRGGIWRFSTARTGQTQADGTRFATGLRNVVALRAHPGTGQLYGVQHGRDQLHDLYPDLFTVEQNAEKPAEELVAIDEGDDFGWPYCYFDPETGTKVLAPEYGGDGREVGRCAEKEDPLVGFPGHWAPNDLEFYTGSQFPPRYRGGAFIAFHGSWNRAPLPQAGYNVSFVPFDGGRPGQWEVFADGFRPEDGADGASSRPVGLAMAPDGSLYVTDSNEGRIWRIVWRGTDASAEDTTDGGAP